MKARARATMALPIVIVLLGVLIPLVVGRHPGAPVAPERREQSTYAGRTAAGWGVLAVRAAERGQLDRALAYVKTAEKVDPGKQYGEQLRATRLARRRARAISQNVDRLLGGDVAEVEFDRAGNVLLAYRLTPALPGESLWNLAVALVAAERSMLPCEISRGDRDVYRTWDMITQLNGLGELEVGQRVMIPLGDNEVGLIEARNAEDISKIEAGMLALERGELDRATSMAEDVTGAFARATQAFHAFAGSLKEAADAEVASALRDGALGAADGFDFAAAESLAAEAVRHGAEPSLMSEIEERRARREDELVAGAHELLARVDEIPRATCYAEVVAALSEGEMLYLREAERLNRGTQHAQALDAVRGMLSEAGCFRVMPDGTVLAQKPVGVSYTHAAKTAVEWLIGRELISSGKEFPQHREKTADELAWASYLRDAQSLASSRGVDFIALLGSVDEEAEIRLPNPGGRFVDAEDLR